MHLKNNVRAGFDEFRLTRTKNFRRLARRVSDQKIARQRTRVRFLFRFHLRSREENSRFLSAKPLRAGLSHKRNNVMHDHSIRRPNFRRLHPRILRKSRWNDYVLIINDSRSGNIERLR